MGPRQRGNFAAAAPICTTQQVQGCRRLLVALSPVCGLLRSAKHLFLAARRATVVVVLSRWACRSYSHLGKSWACRPTSSESPETSLMDVAGLASPPSPIRRMPVGFRPLTCLEGGASLALCWRLLALPESRRWLKVAGPCPGDLSPGKTPVQARQRVGLTRWLTAPLRLARRLALRSPALAVREIPPSCDSDHRRGVGSV